MDGLFETDLKQFLIVKKILNDNPDCKRFGPWLFYCSNSLNIAKNKPNGKWLIFNNDLFFLNELCREAVNRDIVIEAKHSFISKNKDGSCVSCYYLNSSDIETHKRLIGLFLEYKAIPRTKMGKLYNIAFKYNEQTRNNEYGNEFKARLHLSDFINLDNGVFLDKT